MLAAKGLSVKTVKIIKRFVSVNVKQPPLQMKFYLTKANMFTDNVVLGIFIYVTLLHFGRLSSSLSDWLHRSYGQETKKWFLQVLTSLQTLGIT